MRNSHADLLNINEKRGIAEHMSEFSKGLIHASLESPVNALMQIGAKATGSERIPKLIITGAPSPDSLAGMAGRMAGTAIDFAILNKASAPAFDKLAIANNTMLGQAIRMGATGGFFEGVLQESDSNSKSFITDRIKAAAVGVSTFASMSLVASGLDKSSLFIVPEARTLLGSALYGAITGTVAGITHAEANAIFKEGRLATFGELGADMKNFAMFGAAYGIIGYASNRIANRINESNDSRPTSFQVDDRHVVKSITRDARGNVVEAVVTRPALDNDYYIVRDTFSKYTDGRWGNMGKFENYRNAWGFKRFVKYMPHGRNLEQLPDGTLQILRKEGVEFLRPNNQGREIVKYTSPDFKSSEVKFAMAHHASDEHGYRTYENGKLKQTFKGKDQGTRVDLNEDGSPYQVVVQAGKDNWLAMRQSKQGEWSVDRSGEQFSWKGTLNPINDGNAKGGWTFNPKSGGDQMTLRPQTQPSELMTSLESQIKLVETATKNPIIKVDKSGAVTLQASSEPYYAKTFVNGSRLTPDTKTLQLKPGDNLQIWVDIGDRGPQLIGKLLKWGLAPDGKTPTLDGKLLTPGALHQLKLPTESTATLNWKDLPK
ncbi:MAG: hypothetical protein K2X77_14315 [Candidatus Obscuribacterales bacterium]|nr:hypothetical protein [Candidatus Obscuribacterales bacterium]